MNHHENKHRKYYGPPRMESSNRDLADIRSHRGMPGGKAPEDRYTDLYGERGVGWDFDTTRHSEGNELTRAFEGPEAIVAREGLRNLIYSGRYETDSGVDLRGKVQLRSARPPMGDIVVYPDGTAYHSEHHGADSDNPDQI